MKLVTWNCWFGEHRFAARTEGILRVLAASDADVLCLQEVTQELWEALAAAPFIKEGGYQGDVAPAVPLGGYGVALLSRLPLCALRFCALPTTMERSLALAVLDAGAGRRLAVGAVHLESMGHSQETRVEQLEIIQPLLREAAPDALWAGDFNFHEDGPEQAALEADFLDLWPRLRGAAPGYTVDTEHNGMLAVWKGGKRKQARYDRVLLRSPAGAFRAQGIELVGTEPLPCGAWPSDHFGLAVLVR